MAAESLIERTLRQDCEFAEGRPEFRSFLVERPINMPLLGRPAPGWYHYALPEEGDVAPIAYRTISMLYDVSVFPPLTPAAERLVKTLSIDGGNAVALNMVMRGEDPRLGHGTELTFLAERGWTPACLPLINPCLRRLPLPGLDEGEEVKEALTDLHGFMAKAGEEMLSSQCTFLDHLIHIRRVGEEGVAAHRRVEKRYEFFVKVARMRGRAELLDLPVHVRVRRMKDVIHSAFLSSSTIEGLQEARRKALEDEV